MKHQKPGLVPPGRRMLGNPVRGKVKMEIFGDQGGAEIEIEVRADEGNGASLVSPTGHGFGPEDHAIDNE